MELQEKLLLLAEKTNGIITFKNLNDNDFTKRQIKKLENDELLERISKGIYMHTNYLKDDLKLYQLENSNFIYSNETAAYLLGLSDRFPRMYSVTTFSGYHLRRVEDLKVFYTKRENFELGVIEIKDNAGNFVKVYDKEKTICDLIKNKERIELQVYSEAIQNYFKGKINLNRLSKYAKLLGIANEVSSVVHLMMKQ